MEISVRLGVLRTHWRIVVAFLMKNLHTLSDGSDLFHGFARVVFALACEMKTPERVKVAEQHTPVNVVVKVFEPEAILVDLSDNGFPKPILSFFLVEHINNISFLQSHAKQIRSSTLDVNVRLRGSARTVDGINGRTLSKQLEPFERRTLPRHKAAMAVGWHSDASEARKQFFYIPTKQ